MKALVRFLAMFATIVALVLNIYVELDPRFTIGALVKLSFLFVLFVLFYLAMFFGQSKAERQKRMRFFTAALFFYYVWLLLNVLFFDNAFRHGFSPSFSFEAVNLVPFKTIHDYLSAYGYGNISLELVILNLCGNAVAFAPMGFLLPALFRWQRSIFFYTATLFLVIVSVELIQVYTGVGACDIDDLILNLGGALFVFLVYRITPLWKKICHITPRKGDNQDV